MRYKWIGLSAFLGTFLFLSTAGAQEDYSYSPFLHRMEVFANVGTGSWESGGQTAGWLLGGGVVFRPYPKAGFELSVRHLRTVDENRGNPEFYWKNERSGTIVTGSVHYYFTQLRFQPYVLLGGGYAGTRTKSVYRTSEVDDSHESSQGSLVLEAGSGVDIFVTEKFSIRPDARLLIGYNSSVQGSANFCYHW